MNNNELKKEIEVLSQKTEQLTKKASKRFGIVLPFVLLGTIAGAYLAMQAASGGTTIPAQFIKPAFIGVYSVIIAPWVSFGIAKIKALVSKGKLHDLEKQLAQSEQIKQVEKDNTLKTEKTSEVKIIKSSSKVEQLNLNDDLTL